MSLDPPALRLELYLSWQMLAKCQRQGMFCILVKVHFGLGHELLLKSYCSTTSFVYIYIYMIYETPCLDGRRNSSEIYQPWPSEDRGSPIQLHPSLGEDCLDWIAFCAWTEAFCIFFLFILLLVCIEAVFPPLWNDDSLQCVYSTNLFALFWIWCTRTH